MSVSAAFALDDEVTVVDVDKVALHALEQNGFYETSILSILNAIQSGDLTTGLGLAEKHLEQFPKSQVGHLLHADILHALTAPLSQPGIGLLSDNSEEADKQLSGLKHQIKNRWAHAEVEDSDPHDHVPASLVYIGKHEHVLVADMSAGRLYLYKNNNGEPELVRDYYLTVGSAGYGKQIEGDNKTPVGVYIINQHIKDEELPDLYGGGAFPVNYPNRFDRYRDRTGYGIWLHGTPSSTYARSPWASEGCFVLSNDDLEDISKYISVEDRTPVILADNVQWVTPLELAEIRQQAMQVLDTWKSDWESLNTDAYLRHYSQDRFNLGTASYQQWAKRKKQTNQRKTFIQLDIELKSVFIYPGEKDMFVVKYHQSYLSNNYSSKSQKEQYWQRDESGQWRIIYEG